MLFAQQLERMPPHAGSSAVADPQHRQRLQQARTLDAADVDHLLAERSTNSCDGLLGSVVITADKHIGRAAGKI